MALLYLIRHAQASFLQENYDKLSPRGECQSRLLGEYLATHKILFNRAATGPRIRQEHTAQIVVDAYQAAGIPFPAPQTMPEFDEYQAEEVLKSVLPNLLETNKNIATLYSAFKSSLDEPAQRVTFQKLFEAVIAIWIREEIPAPNVESWQAFTARVNAGLTTFLSAGERGERIVIFTSGGPIAIAMQRALSLSPESTLTVSWASRNTSWSEFLYDATRFTLASFNSHPHLEDPAMLTHR